MIERLWRSVKYEEVYLNEYESAVEAWQRLARYFEYYNFDRPHQSLDYATPWCARTQSTRIFNVGGVQRNQTGHHEDRGPEPERFGRAA